MAINQNKKPLSASHPDIAKEWNYDKNHDVLVSEVTAGSDRRVWWIGKCLHEWESKISNRANGSGCPFCSGKKVLKGFNDLPSKYPEISKEWNFTKNFPKKPQEYTFGSNKKVWWIDYLGHEWESPISNRTIHGTSCPFCKNSKVLKGFNDLETKNPLLASYWDYDKNSKFPHEVTAGSTLKVWFKCDEGHSWESRIIDISSVKLPCKECRSKKEDPAVVITSPASINYFGINYPEIASEWNFMKNNSLEPTRLTSGSGKTAWWICKEGHEWQATVKARIRNGGKCSQCEKNELQKKISNSLSLPFAETGVNDLVTYSKEIAEEWNFEKNNELSPEWFHYRSKSKVWWKGICNHEWEARIIDRTLSHSGCSICCGQQVLVGFNDLSSKFPKVAEEWDYDKNEYLPTQLTYGSGRKCWFQCKQGHSWQSRIIDRTTANQGCPECMFYNFVSQAEKDLSTFLKSYNLTVKTSNRTILNGLEIDIFIPEKKIGIEFNGIYWHTERMGKDKNYHKNKWEMAKNKGIQLIQVWEDEWEANPELVKNMLLHKLGISNPKNKVFARKTKVHHISIDKAKEFLDKHHIQGFATASYYLGLKDKGENLVALLALKRESVNDLNIIRYATSKTVTGGFTRLMSHAEKRYNPDKFITFSDNCVSDGGLYRNNGFIPDKELKPDYRYVINRERKHKFGYRLKRFREDPSLLWEEGLTERELAELNGLDRIWDAGKTRWVKVTQSNTPW